MLSDNCISAARADEASLPAPVAELLAQQVRRWLGAERSSARYEVVQELFLSLCCTLGIDADLPPAAWPVPPGGDWEEARRTGIARLQQQCAAAKSEWAQCCQSLPPCPGEAMSYSLKSIGGFFARYDLFYFAHQIPCDITYPLSEPVPESTVGVYYIRGWLARLACENALLCCFPAADTRALLRRFCRDAEALPLNLFEPCAGNVLGRALAGRLAGPLLLTPQEATAVQSRLLPLSPCALKQCFIRSAADAAQALCLPDAAAAYFMRFAARLSPLAAHVRDVGGLGGIFLTDGKEPCLG